MSEEGANAADVQGAMRLLPHLATRSRLSVSHEGIATPAHYILTSVDMRWDTHTGRH